jgi:hypothetical protein
MTNVYLVGLVVEEMCLDLWDYDQYFVGLVIEEMSQNLSDYYVCFLRLVAEEMSLWTCGTIISYEIWYYD